MAIQPSSPNRYPKIKTKPGRVDLIPEEIDALIDAQGVTLRIIPSILCPNRTDLGGTNHALDCQVCNGDEAVDLENKCVETFGVIQGIEFFNTAFGIVVDNHSEGPQNSHNARGFLVQILSNSVLQQRYVHHAVPFCHADALAEISNCLRCVASPAQTR